MADPQGTFPWTEEQWTRARKVVQDSARRARVASSFLPLYGPLPADQAVVNSQHMSNEESVQGPYDAQERLEVDDTTTIALTTISADIYLRTYEAADPDMTAALAMIGRAADVLGRLEDSLIFNGQAAEGQGPADLEVPVHPPIYRIKGGQSRPGLLTAGVEDPIPVTGATDEERGAQLVGATVKAIEDLERNGHYGPFAQVLGNVLYLAANTPNENSMVLPSDRIRPFLDGPLLRSSTIPRDKGVVVALAGEPIDLVIAHDLELKFVQMTLEPRFVLRLSERFTLRIKQEGAVVGLEATE